MRLFLFAVLRRLIYLDVALMTAFYLVRRHEGIKLLWADAMYPFLGAFIIVLVVSVLDLGDARHESKARPRKDAMRLWADIADPERVAGWRKQG